MSFGRLFFALYEIGSFLAIVITLSFAIVYLKVHKDTLGKCKKMAKFQKRTHIHREKQRMQAGDAGESSELAQYQCQIRLI